MEFFNKTDKGVNLEINDEIGFWGVTHQDVKNQLDSASESDIQLNIASLGGDVNHAFAIYNMLKSHKGRVIANIYGDAASAATLIALGADEVRMADNVFFMIHNVWTMAVGDSGELRKTADLMDKFNDQIKDAYKKKTGLHKAKITLLMDNETWFTAKEAKEHGFVDKVTESTEILNRSEAVIYNSLDKEHAKELINKINNKQNSEMENINEEKVADSVFAKIKSFLVDSREETAKTEEVKNEVSQEELIKNAVATAMEAAAKENEALKAKVAEQEKAIKAKADAEAAAEAKAKAEASTTTTESKEPTAEVDAEDDLEYVNAIKNLVKKVKRLN